MILLKTLTGTIPANSNEITFTDSMISSSSIVEVYYNNDDVYTEGAWQTGNTVGIHCSEHEGAVGIKILINNVTQLSEYPTPSMETLSDVELTELSDGQILMYDNNTEKWVNIDFPTPPTPPTPNASEIEYDNTDSGLTSTNVQDAIDEVFQSVSDGKELIADAITDKGIATSATDTFETMATNISSIPVGGGDIDDMLSALGFTKIEHASYTVVHGTITNNSGNQINGYSNKNMLRIDVNANVNRVVAIVKADDYVINRVGCTSHRSALDQTSGYSQDPSGTRGLMYTITATDEAMIIGTGGYNQGSVITRYVYLEVSSNDISEHSFDVTLYWRN